MSMKENLLIIDMGTQSLRASIVDKLGNTLSFVQEHYDVPYMSPIEGYAEQQVDYYLEILCVATNKLKAKNAEAFDTISGMVIDDFRDSSVILDENKKPIRNSILWLDQRVTLLHGKNIKWWEKIIFSIVGMSDTVKYNSERTPAWWIMKNEPQNWARAASYVPLSAYFNYRITDNLTVSSADCIGHYPIDFKKGKWFPKHHIKYDVFGIRRNQLPPLTPVGQEVGKITKEFAELSSIPEGTPLYASASDKACETLGNGCIDKSQASISLGTACTIDVVDNRYSEPEAFLPSYQAPYPGSWDLEVQIYRGLWMVRWYLEQFGYADRDAAEASDMTLADYLDKKIEDIPVGCEGLILQPYWGAGLARPNARGSIIGFTAVHTRYHIYRAIIEGVAFALREGLDEIMKKTHRKPDYLVVSGGGSDADIILQILADVFGIEVRKASTTQSATLGAAISGYLANGTYKTPQEAVNAMVKPGKIIKPNRSNVKLYEEIYQKIYRKMYPSLKDEYRRIKYITLAFNGEE